MQHRRVCQHGQLLVIHGRRVALSASGAPLEVLWRLAALLLVDRLVCIVANGDGDTPVASFPSAWWYTAVRADLHLRSHVEGRASFVEGPRGHLELLEGIVRKCKEAEHRHNKVRDIRGQIGVVVHVLRIDEELPCWALVVERLAMPAWYEQVLPAVDDHRWAFHLLDRFFVGKPLLDHQRYWADLLPEERPHAEEGRNEDDAGNSELCCECERRTRADGPAEKLHPLQRELQRLCGKLQCSVSVCHDGLAACSPWANAVAWILDRKHVDLELIPEEETEPATTPQVLRIAVEEDDQESSGFVRQ
mmetsp:Transcript_100510/g.174497  ORF Transcript_100510/g.174497 Transcript_100510/m.174497 type:complete len:305 (+) Transcript_100510:571-1485(+)